VEIISPQALFGSCEHATLERLLLGESVETVLFQNYREFIDSIIEAEYIAHDVPRAEESFGWADEWLPELINATVKWKEQTDPFQLSPMFVEERFTVSIYDQDDLQIVLNGTPDLVETDGKLWDWKTAGYGWKPGKAEATIQNVYRFMVDSAGYTHRQINYMVWNRKDAKWTIHEVFPSDEFLGSVVARIVEYGKMVAADVYPATPLQYKWGKPERGWYCSEQWCGAWHICPFKNLDI